ncbi:MAG: hypothetical protein E7673_02485 [Ruminococcaceae bacterium]|nr:hypothetical protein [Oscillospiraceae bacterium]
MESYINIDKNMIVEKTVGDIDVVWRDVKEEPFMLHGFYEPLTEPYFHRLPSDVAEATSVGVSKLERESAGGRVRFSTDSPYIAVRAKFKAVGRSSHLTLISSAGFDLYVDGEFGSRFIKEFRMPYDMVDYYENAIHLEAGIMRSFTVNFPVHSVIEKLEIGLKPDSKLAAPRPYKNFEPIVIYGSSIVHGTAATRPGLTYPAMISRDLNMDYKNIGFSGMAKGEVAIARWMATLPMSVFICDYDHNTPTDEHLENTHFRLYEIIREKNPDVPYIMISRPDFWTMPRDQKSILNRRDTIMRSYLKAREMGDKNVYFIDGISFFATTHQFDHTVDGCHPNDTGFIRMADSIGAVIKYAIEKKEGL